MYKFQYEDYQPQHPMLLEFDPSAGMFGPSKCGKKASDEAIKAFYLHYRNNPENKEEYSALKKKYGCYMTAAEAKAAFKELGMKERIRQAKVGFAAQEAERGYDGLKPMHPLLREFEASAGCKPAKKPGMFSGKKAKKNYEKAVRCAKIAEGVEAAFKRIPKETMKLLKGLNRTELQNLKNAIKDAAGGYKDGVSTEDVLKALKGPLEFKFANGKKKDVSTGKMRKNMITIQIG